MTHDGAARDARWSAEPASARSTDATVGFAPPASADVPTWHVEQCVLDFRWQTRSWWANGIAASATKYAASTHRRVTPSRGPEDATSNYTAEGLPGVYGHPYTQIDVPDQRCHPVTYHAGGHRRAHPAERARVSVRTVASGSDAPAVRRLVCPDSRVVQRPGAVHESVPAWRLDA